MSDSSLTQDESPVKRGPGRPRHADTEERAYRAVLELFGQKGFDGMSLDAVAQTAGVGKSSIYLRWKNKRELLLEAIKDMESHHVYPDDEGLGIRDYLISYGRGRAQLYLGEYGAAMVSLISASYVHPAEFQDLLAESISRGVLQAVDRIARAVDDGELPAGLAATDLLSALEGAIFFRLFIYRQDPSTEPLSAANLDATINRLVDVLLAGLTS